MILASRRDPAQGYDNDDDGEGPRVPLQVEYGGISSIVTLPLLPRNPRRGAGRGAMCMESLWIALDFKNDD
jgi:hypothetical protein